MELGFIGFDRMAAGIALHLNKQILQLF